MKLVLPVPDSYTCRPQPPGRLYEGGAELRVYVASVAPLPYNLQEWGDEIVRGGLPLAQIKVLRVEDVRTEDGWPLTLFESEVVDQRNPLAVVRRLHALYRFLEFGAVAVVYSTPRHVDAHRQELVALLQRGAPDLTDLHATSIADFFAELPVSPGDRDSAV